jgi:hypothetical protein
MTLILELPEQLESRLRAAARLLGGDEAEAARQALERGLPPIGSRPRRRTSVFGKYSGVGGSVDDFLRDKHSDTAREEAAWSDQAQAT